MMNYVLTQPRAVPSVDTQVIEVIASAPLTGPADPVSRHKFSPEDSVIFGYQSLDMTIIP